VTKMLKERNASTTLSNMHMLMWSWIRVQESSTDAT